MKVSDYIVNYLIEKEITDVFGYPGGMVTHLMDSFEKYKKHISAHVNYHEQGASFAACGYSQTSGKVGVAYATSGPGATNLITGICNAYFDSIPTLFITGQVNSFESKGNLGVRQRGFQETDVLSMVGGVTKFSAYVDNAEKIKFFLDKAFYFALEGRKGPVVLDIPMNIQRAEIDPEKLIGFESKVIKKNSKPFVDCVFEGLQNAHRPCILVGNGIKIANAKKEFRLLVDKLKIPVVCSMLSTDIIPKEDSHEKIESEPNPNYGFGFVGAYGDRVANFIVAKSDLLITIGSRLDIRQVGAKRENFAPNAKIIRVDIDSGELTNRVREDETQFVLDIYSAIHGLNAATNDVPKFDEWLKVCKEVDSKISSLDIKEPNVFVKTISAFVPDDRSITTDVGQNQVWVAQSFKTKANQELLFSGGHGAMGYSLPAAIGAYFGNKKPVICFNGDGGFQMNIQELQFIAKERLPIKIIILNNQSLGMIRHFQEMYFEDRYVQTMASGGYITPDFCSIASAYGIKNRRIENVEDLSQIDFLDGEPELIDIVLKGNTYVFPKLEFGKPNQDQEPLLDRELFNYLMEL